MNNNKKNKAIYSAVELWTEISNSAAFDDVDYDSALLDDIKSYLGIDKNADLETELKNITVEELLNALFTSIKPFSEMLKDLLEVFSKAGAKYGDKNLKIAVNFGELKIDFEKFKFHVETISEKIHKAVKTYYVDDPWGLRELFKFDENSYNAWDYAFLNNDEICEWVESYKDDRLPSYFPKQPKCSEDVDCRIKVIWNYLREIYGLVKSIYKEEVGIQKSSWDVVTELRQQIKNDHNGNVKHILDQKQAILQNETDRYIGTMMVAIAMFVEYIQKTSKDEKYLSIERFKVDFDKVFSDFNSTTHTEIVEKISQINSFLNLPYWRHRYEIYSAWVFTLIAKAFGYSHLNYKLQNGDTLSFSFGGSHLATYEQGEPLEIWAECKSKAISQVIGKGRSKGIQPDYTIAYSDAKVPCNAVAVVECKQYKKSSTGNFSKAIIDYANNRPNAKIFLVNYGAVGTSVKQNVVDKGIDESRFATFGCVRPQNSDSFVSALKSYLFEPMKIILTWGKCPTDLDLMLEVTDLNTGDKQLISYDDMGKSDSPPYAVLDDDCISGYGPENITIFKFENGKKYSVIVNRFSHENEISDEVTLKVECIALRKEFSMDEIFETWNVCTIEDY